LHFSNAVNQWLFNPLVGDGNRLQRFRIPLDPTRPKRTSEGRCVLHQGRFMRPCNVIAMARAEIV
jgi:hypothetical protein